MQRTALTQAQRLYDEGQPQAALSAVGAYLAQAPDDVQALRLRVMAALQVAPAQAVDAALRFVQAQPSDMMAHNLCGQALSAAGRGAEAVLAFETAVGLAPQRADILSNLSIALTRKEEFTRAEDAARRALALSPGYLPALNAVGHATAGRGDHAAAQTAFAEVLAHSPRNVDALVGLGQSYFDAGAVTTAILAWRRALLFDPKRSDACTLLASAYRMAMSGDEAAEAFRTLVHQQTSANAMVSNALFDMHYDPNASAELIAGAERRFGETALATTAPALVPDQPADGTARPLRIGYVSADLGRHAVGWLGIAALAAHDPARVQVTIYDMGGRADAMTEKLRSAPAVTDWVDIRNMDDASAIRRIMTDNIDVLVDLSGHTRGNRLGIFAARAAPVQIGWLGYPGSSGVATMDHVLFDAHHCDDGAEALFTERLVRLPHIRFAYCPPDDAPEVAPPPVLQTGRITFGSFNNTSKINPDLIQVWSRVLSAVPDSRMLLKWQSLSDDNLRRRIGALFEKQGIAPDRILFAGQSPHRDMLAVYAQVDIALDTFPFSGGVTTAEALFMGVPAVSRFDRRIASRQGLAFVSELGHPDWAQTDEDRFVSVAVELARDQARLSQLRASQRARFLASPICDGARLARDLEDVFARVARPART